MSNRIEKDLSDLNFDEEMTKLKEDNKRLREVLLYALKINERQHRDDYAYDDCWGKMRELVGENIDECGCEHCDVHKE